MKNLLSVLFLANVLLFAMSTMAADTLGGSSNSIKDEMKINDAIPTQTPEPNTMLLKEKALGTPASPADATNLPEAINSQESDTPIIKISPGRIGHGTPGVTREMLQQELARRKNVRKIE